MLLKGAHVMIDKVKVFSKRTGEPNVPVTVRIEWLPDGTIKPLQYWMPDDSCYEINHIYEMTPLAYLKEQGEGIRFKVKSRIIKSMDLYVDYQFSENETYLYFADNWFCGKNIIDDRYSHKNKEFIPVTLDVFPNGEYELVYFKVNEARYMVEKTITIEPRGSFYAGGIGVWHKVETRQINDDNDEDFDTPNSFYRTSVIFFEINKWFVGVKST